MKKLICCAVCLVLAGIIGLFAFAPVQAFAQDTSDQSHQTLIEEYHREFVTECPDRRSFMSEGYDYGLDTGEKKGEQKAADFVLLKLYEMGYSSNPPAQPLPQDGGGEPPDITQVNVILQSFSQRFSVSDGGLFSTAKEETRWSQNVILRFDSPLSASRIIVGTGLDADYSADSHGAMDGGAGVAVLLTLAHVLRGSSLPFDVDLVFFGASKIGTESYFLGADKYMDDNNSQPILTMLNIGRLGADTTYVYTDEVQNPLSDYITAKAGQPLPLSKIPMLTAGENGGRGDLSYSHYGQMGNHARFLERGIPSVHFFSAFYNGIDLTDKEGAAGMLGEDSLNNLNKNYPDAYQKMNEVFGAITQILYDENLPQIIENTLNNVFNYQTLTKKWIAYLIFGGLVAIGFVLTVGVSRFLLRKYPPRPNYSTQARPKKEDVFGDEFK